MFLIENTTLKIAGRTNVIQQIVLYYVFLSFLITMMFLTNFQSAKLSTFHCVLFTLIINVTREVFSIRLPLIFVVDKSTRRG